MINDALGRGKDATALPDAKIRLRVPVRSGGTKVFHGQIAEGGWVPPAAGPQFGVAEDLALLELIDGETFPLGIKAHRHRRSRS
ncbi:hypothetical protein JMJ92_15595 [Rhodovulum visakhapatnamense]|uniref:Uncharacterized protein n=1 Tax=Rhodovulum visakhapatnamense TaxID=364297 RepID=A0ABS1RL17_9RHOB|nr:hypothetical protein [Rhodovulum visakhapatnamense]